MKQTIDCGASGLLTITDEAPPLTIYVGHYGIELSAEMMVLGFGILAFILVFLFAFSRMINRLKVKE